MSSLRFVHRERLSHALRLLNCWRYCVIHFLFYLSLSRSISQPATPPPEQHPFLKQITGKENEILRGMAEPFVSTDNNNASLDLSLGVKGLLVSQTVPKEDVSAEAASTSKSDIGKVKTPLPPLHPCFLSLHCRLSHRNCLCNQTKISDLVKRMRNPSTGLVIKDRR